MYDVEILNDKQNELKSFVVESLQVKDYLKICLQKIVRNCSRLCLLMQLEVSSYAKSLKLEKKLSNKVTD